jgi:hypothetical protein
MSFAPSTAVSSTPSLMTTDANDVPATMDWQTIRCRQAVSVPFESKAAPTA